MRRENQKGVLVVMILSLFFLLSLLTAVYAQEEPKEVTIKKLRGKLEVKTPRYIWEREKENLVSQNKAYANKVAALTQERDKLRYEVRKVKTEKSILQNKNRRLKKELMPVNELKERLASACEELGTAYTHTKNYNMAIDAYVESLKYGPRNPKVYYNLGLLYQHVRNDTQKSVYYLKRYLQLSPNAKDKKEVEYLVKTLSEIAQVEFK